jgi:hypothetical protein
VDVAKNLVRAAVDDRPRGVEPVEMRPGHMIQVDNRRRLAFLAAENVFKAVIWAAEINDEQNRLPSHYGASFPV